MIPMSRIDQMIRRAQHGDSGAVAWLYENYAQLIYRYIYYRVGAQTDAEDLTAEVFVKMVEGLPSYRLTGAPFEAWLYRIAEARIIDFRRRANRRPQVELLDNLIDQSELPEEHAQAQQELEQLLEALRKLNDEHQTILILRFVERKSHEEVAQLLNKSVTAVKSAQHRALMQMVTLLGSEDKVRHYLRGES
jgi:RNA polymerase sigma-70 factor (ECF subfamily)